MDMASCFLLFQFFHHVWKGNEYFNEAAVWETSQKKTKAQITFPPPLGTNSGFGESLRGLWYPYNGPLKWSYK